MNKQQQRQRAAKVVEASLGNVKPLLSELGSAECEAEVYCNGTKMWELRSKKRSSKRSCSTQKPSFMDQAVDQVYREIDETGQ